MRAAFSLPGLVTVAAIVLALARKQDGSLPAAPGGPGAAAASAALPAPQAIGQQVQGSIDEAARKAAEAASAATN